MNSTATHGQADQSSTVTIYRIAHPPRGTVCQSRLVRRLPVMICQGRMDLVVLISRRGVAGRRPEVPEILLDPSAPMFENRVDPTDLGPWWLGDTMGTTVGLFCARCSNHSPSGTPRTFACTHQR